MDEGNVIEERDGFRVVLKYEQDAQEPDFAGQSPLLRIEPNPSGRYGVGHLGTMADRPRDTDESVEAAVRRWGSPASSDWDKFEKWLRAYLGVTQIETFYSGSYWYVTYDAANWREYTGAPAGSASLSDYQAWAEGEVYYWEIQKQVTWSSGTSQFPDREDWETVDALGEYYGYDNAEVTAKLDFAEFLKDRDKEKEASDIVWS